MALFAGEPAGVQIRKWLVILVSLIVLINVLAACSLVVLQRSVTAIRGKYLPVMLAAGEISSLVYQAQASLYRYLGEYLPDTAEVEKQTAELERTVEAALRLEAAREWQGQLEAVRDALARYRVVVRNLPAIGVETDWGEVDEFRAQAVTLGRAMEEEASGLKGAVVERINDKARGALQLSRWAVIVFVALLGLSVVITFLLLLWWRQFQDMILNL